MPILRHTPSPAVDEPPVGVTPDRRGTGAGPVPADSGADGQVSTVDLERLQTAWQEAVFALYLAEEKIEPEVVESYDGWYSNTARGLRRRAAEAAAAAPSEASARRPAAPVPARSRASQTWAMLIKRVYEIDPLNCPRCAGQMKVVAFLEPPQGDVIEKILRHGGLWRASSPRAPPAGNGWVHDPDGDADSHSAFDEPRELTFVDEATFWATF